MRHFTSYKPRRRLNTHERRRVSRLELGHIECKTRCEDIGGVLVDHVVHGKVMCHPDKGLWPKMRWQRCLVRCPRAERHGPRAKGPRSSPWVEARTRLRRWRWGWRSGRWWPLCLQIGLRVLLARRCAGLEGAKVNKGAVLCLGPFSLCCFLLHPSCFSSLLLSSLLSTNSAAATLRCIQVTSCWR